MSGADNGFRPAAEVVNSLTHGQEICIRYGDPHSYSRRIFFISYTDGLLAYREEYIGKEPITMESFPINGTEIRIGRKQFRR